MNETFVEVSPDQTPPYMHVYNWEKQLELTPCRQWVGRNWMSICSTATVVYLMLIFTGQKWMKTRRPFEMRLGLTIWNISLAAFSILGFLRTAPEIWYLLTHESSGFYDTVCTRKGHNSATAFWGFVMTMSKLVELGDTAFIVLRKQPLIFLHYYHHITVMLYTWRTYSNYEPSLRWFMTVNMFIHGFMYVYYALRSMKFKVPRQWAMSITFLQLSQMVFGLFINIYSVWIKSQGLECARDEYFIRIAFLMYASYFVLFTHFFYSAYFKKPKNKKE